MEVFIQQLINGITLGSIYGLIAIGYTMVFGIIGMVNFAHGDVFMVSAFIALITFLILTTWLGIGSVAFALLIMLIVAMLLTSLVNWVIGRVAYRPLRGSFRLAPLISAIGMSIFLQNYVQIFQGARVKPLPPIGLSHPELVMPAWDLATLIGLGVPLYLVTMASQNLPGFAVLRASGYQPPTQPALAVTGAASLVAAFMGAHTSNLAAISAALCTGPEAHPDPAERWKAGVFYALWWGLIALFGASLVGLFAALPPALLVTVAGLALLGSMASAMGAAVAAEKERFAAAGTLAVTVSGVTLMGVGSAFWGLCFGLLVMGVERLLRR